MKKKTLLTLGVVALVAALAVAGVTAAWLTSAAAAVNGMTPAVVEIAIEEDFTPPGTVTNSPVTKQVSIRNKLEGSDGRPGTDAYIRVAIMPVWRNGDGTGTGLSAVNVSLNLNTGASDNWFKEGDYYYYKNPVAPGGITTPLLNSYTVTGDLMEYAGKKLEITVVATAIQAIGSAAADNWPTAAVSKLVPMASAD